LSAALVMYNKTVLQHNRQRILEVISQVNNDHGGAPADPENDEDCEDRLVDIYETWFSYSAHVHEFPRGVRKPEDILTVASAIPDRTLPLITPEKRD